MYIVPLAWLYVVVLMAASEDTIFQSVMTLILWGVIPIGIFMYIFGTPGRRRAKAQAEQLAELSAELSAEQPTNLAKSALPDALSPSADDGTNGDKKKSDL